MADGTTFGTAPLLARITAAEVLAFAAPALLEDRRFALRAVASEGRSLESLGRSRPRQHFRIRGFSRAKRIREALGTGRSQVFEHLQRRPRGQATSWAKKVVLREHCKPLMRTKPLAELLPEIS